MQIPSKITKNNSQGINFAIISCQRVDGLALSMVRKWVEWVRILSRKTHFLSETGRMWFRSVRFETPNSVSFFALTESGERAQRVSLSLLFVCKSKLTEFFAELTEFAQKLGEFSLPKQCSRNSILPVFPFCPLWTLFGDPIWGRQKGVIPICSDSPFPSDLFRFALLLFGIAPICSDFSYDLFSEQIRETPFCQFCKSPTMSGH